MQDASRDLFIYTVKCIQIRRKLRIEKRQQVWTLPPPGAGAWPCPALPGPSPASFLSAGQTLAEQCVPGDAGRDTHAGLAAGGCGGPGWLGGRTQACGDAGGCGQSRQDPREHRSRAAEPGA